MKLLSCVLGSQYCTLTHLSFMLTQSCPTLCDPMDCSPPDSSVHRILQARIMEWVAITSFRGSSQPKDQSSISCIIGNAEVIWEAPRCTLYASNE